MIFRDKFDENSKPISAEFDRLLELGMKTQNHEGDLLLYHINGFFDNMISRYSANNSNRINPHVIGLGMEGFSEITHYKFIHQYRTTNRSQLTLEEYHKEVAWAKGKEEKVNQLIEYEELSIQLEMLVYLKFWESDMTIKRLYQLTRILHGEPYDWYFKIQESPRDNDCTGSRQDIIRKLIRDRLIKISPIISELITNTYKTQIRNAIAHSNYTFMGRSIVLTNFIEKDIHSQLSSILFDDWINIFHNTLVLHNECIRIGNIINEYYAKEALNNSGLSEVFITEKQGKQYKLPIKYRQDINVWNYA